jgi:hypothetical protein
MEQNAASRLSREVTHQGLTPGARAFSYPNPLVFLSAGVLTVIASAGADPAQDIDIDLFTHRALALWKTRHFRPEGEPLDGVLFHCGSYRFMARTIWRADAEPVVCFAVPGEEYPDVLSSQSGGNMELITLVEQLVTDGELVDASDESQAVFGSGILAVITRQLDDTLKNACTSQLLCANSPVEEMLLTVKRGFGTQLFLEDVADIRNFLSRGKQTYVALPELLDYLLLVVPLPTIVTLFICGPEESPESFGIRM